MKEEHAKKPHLSHASPSSQETEESTGVLDSKAHRHTLSITHIEIITTTVNDHDSVKMEFKEEPMSPQCIEESEMDGAEHLKLEESENDEDIEGEFLADVDIQSNTLTDHRDIEQDSDPLNVCVPVEDIKTEEMTCEGNMYGAEYINWKEYEGAMTSKKCEQTPAENKNHVINLTPGGKIIPEKLTRLESKTVVEKKTQSRTMDTYTLGRNKNDSQTRHVSTKTSMCSDTAINEANVSVNRDNDYTSTDTDVDDSSSKYLMNMFICNDCGDMYTEKYLLIEHMKHHDVIKRRSELASDERSSHHRTTLHERKFSRPSVGIKNIKTHGGKNRLHCEICQRKFSQNSALSMHMRTHTGEKPYECDLCKYRFKQKGALQTHMRTHTGEKPFECEICNGRFSSKYSLQSHLRTHTGEKPFECEICNCRFRHNSTLYTHLLTHTDEKLFECEICKVRVSTKQSLKKHLLTHTGKVKPFECEICKARFNQKSSLNVHLKIHTGEKPFQCETCKVRFNRRCSLKTHLRTHTREKPFECKICKVRFTLNGNLKRHLRSHNDEKPFECEICKNRFTQKSSLKTHLRTHTGEKPFKCEICKVRFNLKHHLHAHLRIHTGEKPFECVICKARFNQKTTLNGHLQTHTRKSSSARGVRRRRLVNEEGATKL